jgi:hypothetical protein
LDWELFQPVKCYCYISPPRVIMCSSSLSAGGMSIGEIRPDIFYRPITNYSCLILSTRDL